MTLCVYLVWYSSHTLTSWWKKRIRQECVAYRSEIYNSLSLQLQDIQEMFDDAMHIAGEFFGLKSQHAITMLNNMGVRCLWAQHYDLAARYLRSAIERAEVRIMLISTV